MSKVDKKSVKTSNKGSVKTSNKEPQHVPAGCFSSWLRRTRWALLAGRGSDVPCGECKGCCKSSYFIHIGPEELKTLASIDKKLLFQAPGLPKGNMVLGHFKDGRCPMLIDDKCAIYKDRSLTCRIYDCRIFAAAGILAGERDKHLINERIKLWDFDYPTADDLKRHLAVKAAAAFIEDRKASFPQGTVPGNPSQIALLALQVYEVFMNLDESIDRCADSEVVDAIIKAKDTFESQKDAIIKKLVDKQRRQTKEGNNGEQF